MRTSVATVVGLLALGVLGPHASGQAPQTQPPRFTSGIDLVTVDVAVLTRGGQPMTELTVDDFVVKVDGTPRPIVSMRLVRADRATPGAARPATATPEAVQPRTFVLVIDRDHIPMGEGQPTLEAAAKFVDGLSAVDRIALWTLPNAGGALRFTESREAMKDRLRMAVGLDRRNYGRWNVGRDEAVQVDDNMPGVLQALILRECYKLPQWCASEVRGQAIEMARDVRVKADATLAGLGSLVDALAPLDGPKHLVLVTGGPVTTRDNVTSIAALGQRAAAARVTIHALQIHDPSGRARADEMRPTTGDIDQSQSAAYLVAGATGGMAVTPVTGVIGFDRLNTELSAGYVLIVETRPEDRDGKVHKIDVAVKDRGWGSSVRARRSFRIDPQALGAPSISVGFAPAAPAPEPPAAPALPPEPVGTDPGDLADRMADYAELFERVATAVVAEERYVQIIYPWRGAPGGPDKEPALVWLNPGDKAPRTGPIIARRQLVSDVLLAQTRDQQWVSYRDVAEVDGEAVRDRSDRVQRLFLSGSPDRFSQFQAIAMESSRYNLGDLKRDVNLPTVALSLLRRANHPRFEFKRQKDETIDGRLCRVLAYREKLSPSLISTRNSGDVFIYGRVWLEQADGRIRRTEFRFDRGVGAGGMRSYIRVDYGQHDGLDVLFPVRMWEWHEGVNQLGRIGGDLTGTQGLATYTKIRRFQVSTSEVIRPPQP